MTDITDLTEALVAWCDDRGTVVGVEEFSQFLHDRNMSYLLPGLLKELEARQKEESFYKHLQITTARSLSDLQVSDLAAAFDAPKEAVSTRRDPLLLGGVSCEYGGVRTSDSFRGRLDALQASLQI